MLQECEKYLDVFNITVMRQQAEVEVNISTEDLMITKKESGERGGSVVESQTPEREVRGWKPTSAMLCP